MRQDQFEYTHECKEGINEILWLQRKHREIIDNDREPTKVKQASLVELHNLSITLSTLYDVAPSIVNGITYQLHQKLRQFHRIRISHYNLILIS